MKKRWTEEKFKTWNRVRAAYSLERRSARKMQRRRERRDAQSKPDDATPRGDTKAHRSPLVFRAPVTLSLTLLDGVEPTAKYFAALQRHRKRRDVFVDLGGVTVITPDAIAMLIAIVKFLGHQRSVLVSGNYPDNRSAKDAIRRSGFDQFINTRLAGDRATRGAIVKGDRSLDATQADGEDASRLIDFAAEGRNGLGQLQASYAHLIECMGNTHQHAGGRNGGVERWWASVYRDSERGCDCFTFIDMGVGIFNSVELGLRLKMYNLFDALRPSILSKLLHGEIPSSTGMAYRGRGLPSIYQSCVTERSIQRLVIITNDVHADTEADRFRALPDELRGVVLYWEVPNESR